MTMTYTLPIHPHQPLQSILSSAPIDPPSSHLPPPPAQVQAAESAAARRWGCGGRYDHHAQWMNKFEHKKDGTPRWTLHPDHRDSGVQWICSRWMAGHNGQIQQKYYRIQPQVMSLSEAVAVVVMMPKTGVGYVSLLPSPPIEESSGLCRDKHYTQVR